MLPPLPSYSDKAPKRNISEVSNNDDSTSSNNTTSSLNNLPPNKIQRGNQQIGIANLSQLGMYSSYARGRDNAPRRWTTEEDDLLVQAVKLFGENDWKINSDFVGTRDNVQCRQRWQKVLMPGLQRGKWSKEEDAILRSLVDANPKSLDWADIASKISGRSSKQCKERWFHHLSPDVNTKPMTAAEDEMLRTLFKIHGNSWSKIAKAMPGRTENMVRSRLQLLLRLDSDSGSGRMSMYSTDSQASQQTLRRAQYLHERQQQKYRDVDATNTTVSSNSSTFTTASTKTISISPPLSPISTTDNVPLDYIPSIPSVNNNIPGTAMPTPLQQLYFLQHQSRQISMSLANIEQAQRRLHEQSSAASAISSMSTTLDAKTQSDSTSTSSLVDTSSRNIYPNPMSMQMPMSMPMSRQLYQNTRGMPEFMTAGWNNDFHAYSNPRSSVMSSSNGNSTYPNFYPYNGMYMYSNANYNPYANMYPPSMMRPSYNPVVPMFANPLDNIPKDSSTTDDSYSFAASVIPTIPTIPTTTTTTSSPTSTPVSGASSPSSHSSESSK